MIVRRVPALQRENLNAGSDFGEGRMPGLHDRFDPMGLVIDWLDACKERRLSSLLDLYDESATLECCCEGKTLHGWRDLLAYWGPKLAHAVIGAFEVDALFPETDGVCLDYRAFATAFIGASLVWLIVSVAAWHLRRKMRSMRKVRSEKARGSATSRSRYG